MALAQFRPYMAIALLCFYPNILWASSSKPFITLYPIYFLIIFLGFRYFKQILLAIVTFRYRICVIISIVIITWSFLTPWFYPSGGGEAFTFASNPNYRRWLEILVPLILLPASIRNRADLHRFLFSAFYIIIVIHCIAILGSTLFLLFGHSFHEIHRMVFLNMRPIYWESGLLLLFIAYSFINFKISPFILIFLAIIGCAGLILGNSRTRFLSTFLCTAYFIYPYVSKRLFFWGMSFFLLLSTVAGGTAFFSGTVSKYFTGLVDQRIEQSVSDDVKTQTSGRNTSYEYAINRWKTNTLFGVGSCYIYPTKKFSSTNGFFGRLHNYYLEVLAGQGIIGFTLLLMVLGTSKLMVVKILWNRARETIDGRIIVGLFLWGLINWMFKESWGITYTSICLLSVYTRTGQTKRMFPTDNSNIR